MKKNKILTSIITILCFISLSFSLSACNILNKEHVHDWTNATCTSAKKCNTCGEVEGASLGHTVRVGKCSRCNKLSDTLEVNITSILQSGQGINQKFYNALNYINESYDYKTDAFREMYIDFAEEEFVGAYYYVNRGITACSNYQEFIQIKSNFNIVKTRLDNKCSKSGDTYYLIGTYQTRRDNMLDVIQSSITQIQNISAITEEWT